jgi:hypothetical protein
MSGIGHGHALLAPVQELLAEMLFQRSELLAQSGLSHMQDIGGTRNAAGIDDDDKRFEPSGVHCDAINPMTFDAIVQAFDEFANLKIK